MIAPVLPIAAPATFSQSLLRVTADQYHTMIKAGVIPDGAPYELLDGFIVHKDRARFGGNPLRHDPLHAFTLNLLTQLVPRFKGKCCHMKLQLPIAMTHFYEPEPDAAIIRGTAEDYRSRLATAADTLCVIEAAHSSLARDQETKLAAYAAAGIPQYVIINLQSSVVEIHTQPGPAAGAYRTRTIATPGQSVALFLSNDERLTVPVSDMLP